jgi:hypothetical protein
VRAASQVAKVSEATLYRWLAEPAFSTALRQGRRAAVEHSATRLQAIAADAVDALSAVMSDPKAPAAARVTAAKAVIELAQRGVDLDDLAARVAALEAKQ